MTATTTAQSVFRLPPSLRSDDDAEALPRIIDVQCRANSALNNFEALIAHSNDDVH